MNANELEQYKRELIAEHQAEIAAIDRLIARERHKPSSLNGSSQAETRAAVRGRRRRRSAAAIVREAVMKMRGNFTRQEVEAQIAEDYPNSTVPRRMVAVHLWRLARDRTLETVTEGRGRTPATYRRR